jgi:hypothetical protein
MINEKLVPLCNPRARTRKRPKVDPRRADVSRGFRIIRDPSDVEAGVLQDVDLRKLWNSEHPELLHGAV